MLISPDARALSPLKNDAPTRIDHAFEPFFNANIDADVIGVGHEDLARYKIVMVAGDYIMDEASAAVLRKYIENGGMVIMTGYSA